MHFTVHIVEHTKHTFCHHDNGINQQYFHSKNMLCKTAHKLL